MNCPGSFWLADRQAQARQQKLAVFGVPQVGVRYHDRNNGAQLGDHFSCALEPPHLCIAGGEVAVRLRVARILWIA